MSFACQRDSYQQELDSRVIKCQPSNFNGNACYEVICEDTILFPEGGGQVSQLTASNIIAFICQHVYLLSACA